jgi:hypothetical protein
LPDSACLRAWAARLIAVAGRRPAAGGRMGAGDGSAAARAAIRLISSPSARISVSVGDSAMVAVTMKVRTLIPRMSGSRKAVAEAPPISIPVAAGAANTCMAAMPV